MGPLVEKAGFVQEALWLSVLISLPALGASALVAWVASAVQSATQIQDTILSHLPRLLIVAWVLSTAGPWMAGELLNFATRLIGGGG